MIHRVLDSVTIASIDIRGPYINTHLILNSLYFLIRYIIYLLAVEIGRDSIDIMGYITAKVCVGASGNWPM